MTFGIVPVLPVDISSESSAPIVIVGAARSGTKIVRDSLGSLPGVSPIGYDVNFVWRLGNEGVPHDELEPESLSEKQRKRIRTRLHQIARGDGLLVEKTVSSCLRVPFVKSILPDARFVHVVRDGFDVVESACRQWREPTDARYLAKKAREVSVRGSGRYAVSYAVNELRRRRGSLESTWGPRYRGIDIDVQEFSLATVCARQWRLCVERATGSLEQLDGGVFTVRYESFAADPVGVLSLLSEFAGLDVDRTELASATSTVSPAFVGRARGMLTGQSRADAEREIAQLKVRLPVR